MAIDKLCEEAREMVKDAADSVDKLYSVVERLILNCELYRQQRDDAIQSMENVMEVNKTINNARLEDAGDLRILDVNHIKFKNEEYVKVSYVQDLLRKEVPIGYVT